MPATSPAWVPFQREPWVLSQSDTTLEPERAIADTPGRFVLLPQSNSSTRLLLRESLDDPIRAGPAWILWDPMHFVMEQRLLQGVKERIEGRPLVPPLVQVAAHVGWMLAGLGLLGLFVSRRAWRPWVLVPIGLMVPSLWLTGDTNSFLAGFLASGITLAGFLAFGWRWAPPYLLVASGIALVLLLAPDSYAAFGLIFLVLAVGIASATRQRLGQVFRPTDAITAAVTALYVLRTERTAFLGFGALAAIPLGLMVWYSVAAWRSPFALGQGNAPDMLLQQSEPLEALVGLLFSPNRGLLVFSPIFGFSLVFAVYVVRKQVGPRLIPYLLAASLLTYGLYCFWPDWIGGHTYGYRFLIDVIPLLMLIIAVCWNRVVAPYAIVRAAFSVALLASIYIQGLGATTAPCGYDDDPNNINYHHERLWDVSNGEIARCTERYANAISSLVRNYS